MELHAPTHRLLSMCGARAQVDMELLQFLTATDHDIFSLVVFLNLYKLRTTNEPCMKPTQILSVSLNSYAFNKDLLYL